MLVSGQTKRLDIPGEPGEWVEIKMLSWKELEAARSVRLKSVMDDLSDVDTEKLRDLAGGTARDIDDADDAGGSQYDRLALLSASVAAWSYHAEVSEANLELLDEASAAWMHEQIEAFTTRTPAEGKGSSAP